MIQGGEILRNFEHVWKIFYMVGKKVFHLCAQINATITVPILAADTLNSATAMVRT